MASDSDLTDDLTDRVRTAAAAGKALAICGAGTKRFLGRAAAEGLAAEPLELAGHSGILDYQPKELVITARGGTPLDAIDAALAGSTASSSPSSPRASAPGPPWAELSRADSPVPPDPMRAQPGTWCWAPEC